MSDPKIPAEALEAVALAMSDPGIYYVPQTSHDHLYDDLARKALAAALPHLRCSCPVISDVDAYCPQHGRDA